MKGIKVGQMRPPKSPMGMSRFSGHTNIKKSVRRHGLVRYNTPSMKMPRVI